MGGLQFLQQWGSVPVWGVFLLLMGTIVKTYPIIQKNLLDARENRESRYGKRIRELEEAVAECRRECDEQKDKMNKELIGLRRQHVQEQISLIAALIDSVDNPTLKQLLTSLQSVQRALPGEVQVLGDIGEAPEASK